MNDLRAALAGLATGELVRVAAEVPARFGVGGAYAPFAGVPAPPPTGPGPAVLFEQVRPEAGDPSAVLIGLYGTRTRAAGLLGTEPGRLAHRLLAAVRAPVPPVPAGPEAPERVELEPDLTRLPIPVLTDQDAGPYLTLGSVLATDPDTGVRNLSVHRMCVQGPDRLTIWMVPGRHLGAAYQAAGRRGEPLPVAIHLGVAPAVLLSSCCPASLVPGGVDELAVAGALGGAPVRLSPCRSVAAEHISDAEYVLEGEILPEHRPENPAGPLATPEFLGYQGRANPSLPTIRVTAITARPDPILQTVSGPGLEQSVLLGFGMEAAVLQLGGPLLKAVHCHTAGGGQLMVVLQWAKTAEQDDETVTATGIQVLERFRMAKLVLSVDEDVDLESDPDLWWAMVTRMQGDRDLVVLPDREGFPLDPTQHLVYSPGLSADGRTAKVAVDCTVPWAQRHRFTRARFTAPEDAAEPPATKNPTEEAAGPPRPAAGLLR